MNYSDFYATLSVSFANSFSDVPATQPLIPSVVSSAPVALSGIGAQKAILINRFNFAVHASFPIERVYVLVRFSPLMIDNGSLSSGTNYNILAYSSSVQVPTSPRYTPDCKCYFNGSDFALASNTGYPVSSGSIHYTEQVTTGLFEFIPLSDDDHYELSFESAVPTSVSDDPIFFLMQRTNVDWRLRIDSVQYFVVPKDQPDYTDLLSSLLGSSNSIESILTQLLATIGQQVNAPSDFYTKLLQGLFGNESLTSLNNVLYALKVIRTRVVTISDLISGLSGTTTTKVLDYDPVSGDVLVAEHTNRSWWDEVTDYLRSINIDIMQKHKYQALSEDDGSDEALEDAYNEASFWSLRHLFGFTSIADYDNDVMGREGDSLFSTWFSQENADALSSVESNSNLLRSLNQPSQGEYIDFWSLHVQANNAVLNGGDNDDS